jgi:hypothetical protein
MTPRSRSRDRSAISRKLRANPDSVPITTWPSQEIHCAVACQPRRAPKRGSTRGTHRGPTPRITGGTDPRTHPADPPRGPTPRIDPALRAGRRLAPRRTGHPCQQAPQSHRAPLDAIIGLVIMVAIFAFLFPEPGQPPAGPDRGRQVCPRHGSRWLAAACIVNILVFPITAIAAIPGTRLPRRLRQSPGRIPGEQTSFPVVARSPWATQYAILARYGVSNTLAAAR